MIEPYAEVNGNDIRVYDRAAWISYAGTDSISVELGSPTIAPVAGFTASNRTPQPSEPVSFEDDSDNVPTSWLWEYNRGDGWLTFSTSENPSLNLGTLIPTVFSGELFDIRLTATNAAGSNTKTELDYLNVGEE